MRSLDYYTSKAPEPKKQNGFKSLQEAYDNYTDWKNSMADFYMNNTQLKQDNPLIYETLMERELNALEKQTVRRYFYQENVVSYSDRLISGDYDLD